MERPRILIIENSIAVTGALKSITRTAYDLKEHFDFQFLIPTGSRSRSRIEGKGFRVIHELPLREISRRFSSLILYLPFLLLNTFRLKRIVNKGKIDLIHVNDLYNLLPVVYKVIGGPIPYVCHIRFLPDKFPKALFDLWLKLHLQNAEKIITVSHAVMKQLPNHPKITVIHNELPVEERYPVVRTSNQNKSSFTFLYLSNFIRGKGQNFALEAFAKIHHRLPNWKLRFIGGDMGLKKNYEFRVNLQKRAKELGIFNKTEWAGFTDEVEIEYKNADAVLNFSESESFSITSLEALYFGCLVIATACGGPAEIINDGYTGILVPNRDIAAMAAAMEKIAFNEKIRFNMGLAARNLVRNRFSVEKTSFKLKEVYENCLIQAK